uniref:Putative GT4: distantly related to glycogen synthase / starch synthase n=1 Tax=Magnetococcus massalia (strain MO-1) TaxID=451514 RepID=A0A1S7LMA9_MAGMO|nr:Putative GT4 : distantly related to glycogen synthase / starch synthase [Candidatus Magnetococcus massalia]
MRLSFLSHEFPPIGGGAASALDRFTTLLAEQGHEVQILTIGLGEQTEIMEDATGRQIIRYGVGRQRKLSPSLLELIRSYWVLRRRTVLELTLFKPDATIAFFAFPAGHALMALPRALTGPRVVSIRGSDIPGFSPKRWGVFQTIQPWLTRPVLRDADRVMANGSNLVKLTHAFMPGLEVLNTPNGIDCTLFHPAEPSAERERGPLRLLFVGQLIARKRVGLLLQGLQHWGEGGGEAQVTIAGSGPLQAVLQQQAEQLPAGIKVAFKGHVEREAMPALYRDHELLVHLSMAEGISNVSLEAMASGLPLITTPEAAGEEMADTNAAMLLQDPTPGALADQFEQLHHNRERLAEISQGARQRAQQFDWHQSAERFIRALQQLL